MDEKTVEVTEEAVDMPVEVTEAKEGTLVKIKEGVKKHKKLVIGGLIAGGLFVGSKVIKAIRGGAVDLNNYDDDTDDSFEDVCPADDESEETDS